MSLLRMGLHVHSSSAASDSAAMEYARAVKPPMMKFLDGAGLEPMIQACNAMGILTVLRVYEPNQGRDVHSRQIYRARVLDAARRTAAGAIEVSYNEADQVTALEVADKAVWDIQGMKDLEGIGRRAVIGSFGVGWPQLEHWAHYRPALEHAAAHGHFLGLHEYGGGSRGMLAGYDLMAMRGWYAMRYRRAKDQWAGWAHPRILITESGVDHLGQEDVSTPGYKLMPAGYDYARDLVWYGSHLGEDLDVAGWCDFGFAGGKMWEKYDLSTDPATLAAIRRAMTQNGPPPAVPPSPPPERSLFVAATVLPGDGWVRLARRMLGREPKTSEWRALRDLNGAVVPAAGGVVESPWHEPRRIG